MAEAKVLSSIQIKEFVINALKAAQVSESHAQDVAEAMAFAHLRGFDTHGIPCLPGYVECLQEKRFNPEPVLKFEQLSPWSGTLDADNGLGAVGATQAMNEALRMADAIGIGAVAVKRSNHFGAAGAYARLALPRDCIAIVAANSAAVTAPFGAAEPYLGTNPLAIAVPAGEQADYLLDMATSEGSRKKIRKALAEGLQIPPGWAIDSDGNPTTDPGKALEGVMLPFGGAKGSAITLLADLLAGVLSGGNFGTTVRSVYSNQEQECGTGHFILVMKVASFMPVSDFKQRMDEQFAAIRNLKPASGFAEVSYPGERETRLEKERSVQGIPINEPMLGDMRKLAGHLKISFP